MGSSIGSSEELDVSGLHEDKIFVSIRLRPLNEREISRRDACDWECIDRNTLVFRHTLPERSMYPSAYTFDRVFGCDSTTKQVYEEGAREVALSVVSGINSSVFAYGQTSSGKTYTMCGITAFAVADIYDYIEKHKDREFVLKFSAMEIYNEAVRDLLSTDSTPLRLLDDPERGTVVERLTEETLRDRNHLAELLYICEAQRKIGETSLNETSSRSHQILRLTIESAASDYFRAENSSTLSATVNFIDLAGSERASQTLSAGTRLKEGCHINRSLLTLGTVIRKLSKGRNGHVPYRDSKLTRILQNSLGGNARTAIICTMSPARSHVEQSRNTLLFASCAKEVSTNAQVNVVMSDKALVKQLQKELARLESHLRSIESTSMPGDAAALLRERELQIEKMEKEIKEVTLERDLAQARVEELLRLVGDDRASRIDEYSSSGDSSEIIDPLHVDAEGFRMCKASKKYFDQPRISSSSNHYLQVPEIPDNNYLLELHHDEKSEDICKDVQCIEEEEPRNMDRSTETTHVTIPSPDRKETKSVMEVPINEDEMNSPPKEDRESNHDYICDTLKHENKDLDTDEDAITIASPRKEETLTCVESSCDTLKQENENQDTYEDEISSPKKEDRDVEAVSSPKKEDVEELNHTNGSMSCPQKEGNHTNNAECGCEALQQKVEEMKKTMTRLFSQNILEQTPSTKLARSRSCSEVLTPLSSSPWFEVAEKDANAPPSTHEVEMISRKPEQKSKPMSGVKKETFSRIDSSKSVLSACLPAEHTNMSEEDIIDVNNFYRGLKEIAKHRSDSQIDENLEGTEYEDANDEVEEEEDEFKEINENAEAVVVNVQPQDEWKMEFQRQRSQIIELWDQCYVPLVHRSYFFLLFNGDPSDSIYMEVELRRLSFLKTSLERKINLTKSTLTPTKASSIKALTREREMLSKLVHKKLERSEREALYKEWGINLNTKQRSLQMANKVWTDTKETKHVEESAALVAKLVQLMEPGRHLPKEMFGLSFSAAPPLEKRSYSWRN